MAYRNSNATTKFNNNTASAPSMMKIIDRRYKYPVTDTGRFTINGTFAPMESRVDLKNKAVIVDYILLPEGYEGVYADYIKNKDAKATTKAGKIAKASLKTLTEDCQSGFYTIIKRSKSKHPFCDVKNIGRYTPQNLFDMKLVQMTNNMPEQFEDAFQDGLDVIEELISSFNESYKITKDAEKFAKLNDGELPEGVELTDVSKLRAFQKAVESLLATAVIKGTAVKGFVKLF